MCWYCLYANLCRFGNLGRHESSKTHRDHIDSWMQLYEKGEHKQTRITDYPKKLHDKAAMSKGRQITVVYSLLKNGRPMTDYEPSNELMRAVNVQDWSQSHDKYDSGWEFAEAIGEHIRFELIENVKKSPHFGISIDTSVATGELCVDVSQLQL